jgi:tetratricopeptide (TPR) repeat protein
MSDHDHAIADLSEAIRIDPAVALFYNRRGLFYEAKNDGAHALADFTAAIRLDPNYGEA